MSSTRIISTLALLSTALVFAAGCATSTESGDEPDQEQASIANAAAGEREGEEGSATEENGDMPTIDSDGIGTQSGLNCACPAGKVFQNGLCYTPCAAGWSGEGPVCWQNCAATFTDTGWFCQRNSKVISANTSSCPWYNKCGVNSDCNKCPAGYANDGCTCRIDAYIYAQPSYGRGAGTSPTCSSY